MLDDYGFEIYEENVFPLAYLLTFRTYGTWLHGDERTSVGRNGQNVYGTPRITGTPKLEKWMIEEMKCPAVILNPQMRETIDVAIKEICKRREYYLQAVNVRTNHVHAVVSAQRKPERLIVDLKANATKMLRESLLFAHDAKIWSRGKSRRYLWKPRHVAAAIDYVLYGQGDVPFEFAD